MRVLVGVFAVLASLAASVPATAETTAPPPPVIAVVGEHGLNPAHVEFRDTGGVRPTLPPHTVITLPTVGPQQNFADLVAAMQAGPLGRLQPGQLYRIDGTRLLIYIPTGLAQPYDVIEPDPSDKSLQYEVTGTEDPDQLEYRRHGTGAVGSAIGSQHGTAPNAWAVYIPTGDPSGFAWLAEQDWIDAATMSTYYLSTVNGDGVLPCAAAPHVRTFTHDRTFFASSGNIDHTSFYMLNTMTELYLVGGVDKNGNAVMEPRAPTEPTLEDITFSVPYATRTFETGDRYEFKAADYNSLDGTQPFGGTSGASPSTAGRAANIITTARTILGDDGVRPPTVLAERGATATAPATGPLADGNFTAAELSAVLHAVASPKLVGPARYFAEGYGALDTAAIDRAGAVLRGELPLPARPDDDRAFQLSEDARRQEATARGC